MPRLIAPTLQPVFRCSQVRAWLLGRPVTAAAREIQPDDVFGPQRDPGLRRYCFAVDGKRPRRACLPAEQAFWRVFQPARDGVQLPWLVGVDSERNGLAEATGLCAGTARIAAQ